MSRKYLNDRYCVRCGRCDATPYLRKNFKLLTAKKRASVLDVGCGNGRNTKFVRKHGHKVISVDMVDDFGQRMTLGVDPLPAKDNSVDVILANYVMMFLNKDERAQLVSEFKRVAKKDCTLVIELYAAKDSESKTKSEVMELQKQIFEQMGWQKVRYSQERFIVINK